MRKNKKTSIIGIITTIVLLIIIVIISNIKVNDVSSIENTMGMLVMPIQNGLTYLKNCKKKKINKQEMWKFNKNWLKRMPNS